MSEASAQILRLLLHCGMIAREEQDIVRALLRPRRPGVPAGCSAPPPQAR